jgi:hypothetical protein
MIRLLSLMPKRSRLCPVEVSNLLVHEIHTELNRSEPLGVDSLVSRRPVAQRRGGGGDGQRCSSTSCIACVRYIIAFTES